MGFGMMAVFAVSGSMVFLVHQVHKCMLSNFMKKFEFEMGKYLIPTRSKDFGWYHFQFFISLNLNSFFHLNYKFLITLLTNVTS